jgi:hypothetical protein
LFLLLFTGESVVMLLQVVVVVVVLAVKDTFGVTLVPAKHSKDARQKIFDKSLKLRKRRKKREKKCNPLLTFHGTLWWSSQVLLPLT